MNDKIKNDGGPAFPLVGATTDEDIVSRHDGMALRDWFAGQALAGICSRCATGGWRDELSDEAYAVADAMLRARK